MKKVPEEPLLSWLHTFLKFVLVAGDDNLHQMWTVGAEVNLISGDIRMYTYFVTDRLPTTEGGEEIITITFNNSVVRPLLILGFGSASLPSPKAEIIE